MAKIYDDVFTSSEAINKFNLDDLPELSPAFDPNELDNFVNQLKDKCNVFETISVNEATAHEFISVFLTCAVKHIKNNNDSTTRLAVEVDLDGRYGYGNLDYAIFIQSIYALVTEAKMTEMEKGVAQILVQIHSAIEVIFHLSLGLTKSFKWIMLRNHCSIFRI